MKAKQLSIGRFKNRNGVVSFRVFGYLHGERVRRNFATREEAAAEKAALEIRAHQVAAGYRTVLSTLSDAEAREAESVFSRLAGKPKPTLPSYGRWLAGRELVNPNLLDLSDHRGRSSPRYLVSCARHRSGPRLHQQTRSGAHAGQ